MLATEMAKHLHLVSQLLIFDGKLREGIQHHGLSFCTATGVSEMFIDGFE